MDKQKETPWELFFLSEDEKEGKQVIFQFFKISKDILSLEGKLRFFREGQKVIQNPSPNIEKIINLGEHKSYHYRIIVPPILKSLKEQHEFLNSFSLEKKLLLMIEISKSLDYIHQLGFSHLSLRPEYIGFEVSSKKLNVQIQNIGLSSILENIPYTKYPINYFYYLSPEQTGILNIPIDYRSDLYTLGVIFYEILTNKLPIEGDTPSKLVHHHIATIPSKPSSINTKLLPFFDSIILKLLSKDPAERYQTCKGLVSDLIKIQKELNKNNKKIDFVLGQSDLGGKLTPNIPFIGRTKELKILEEEFNEIKNGKGGLCIVTGASGIGKSELLNAFRKPVHIREGFFFTAKYEHSISRVSFFGFIKVLREIFDVINNLPEKKKEKIIIKIKKKLGDRAGALLDILPEISKILGKVQKAFTLEKEAEKFRQLKTLADLITILDIPIVIFLDDMHWADIGSLELLEQLVFDIKTSHVLLILSFRNDEIDETHPLLKTLNSCKQLIDIKEIKISPFGYKEACQMVEAMLHQFNKDLEQFSNIVLEKTYGNPFLMTEFIRLIENQGILFFITKEPKIGWHYDLNKLNDIEFFPGALELVLARIENIDEKFLNLLSFASVVGNSFDFNMLSEFFSFETNESILHVLDKAQDLGLIIRKKDSFSFRHDRIREAFYKKIEPKELLMEWHDWIGKYLEDDKIDTPVTEIATHYLKGKNFKKAYYYATVAGKQAAQNYTYGEAVYYFESAINLWDKISKKEEEKLSLMASLGEAYRFTGMYHEAIDKYQACLKNIDNNDEEIKILLKIGEVYLSMGLFEKGAEILEEALEHLGYWAPKKKIYINSSLIFNGLKVFTYLLFNIKPQKKCLIIAGSKEEVLGRIFRSLGKIYFFIDSKKCAELIFKVKNKFKNFTNHYNVANSCSGLSILLFSLGWIKKAEAEANKGIEISKDISDPLQLGMSLWVRAYGYFYSNEPSKGEAVSDEAIYHLEQCGDPWELCIAYSIRHLIAKLSSDFKTCLNYAQKLYSLALRVKSIQHMGWGLCQTGYFSYLLGDDPKTSLKKIEEGLKLIYQAKDKFSLCGDFAGFKATILADMGKVDNAIAQLEEAIKIAKNNIYRAPHILENHSILARLYLLNYQANPNITYLKKAYANAKKAKRAGKKFPILIGPSLCLIAQVFQARKKIKKAKVFFEKSLDFIENKTRDSFNLALAQFAYARFLKEQNEANWSLQAFSALQIFKELGTVWHEKEVKNFLAKENTESCLDNREAFTKARMLEALLTVNQKISSILDLDTLLTAILNSAIEVSGAKSGTLFLTEDKQNKLQLKKSIDADGSSISRKKAKAPIALAVKALNSNKGIVIDDAMGDIEYKDIPEVSLLQLRSMLIVPIFSKGLNLGVIILENSFASNVFTEDDLKILEALTSQAAISIENARFLLDLKKAEERYRDIFENAVEGIFQSNMQGQFLRVNPSMVKLLGFNSHEELVSSVISIGKQLYVDESRRIEFFNLLQKNGKVMGFESQFHRKDGSIGWGSISARLVYNKDGNITYCEGSVLDITERKEKERAEREREAAESATKAKSEFLANMSHDIRTPMNAIIGFTDLALKTNIKSKQQDYLNKIKISGDNLLGIINDILDFSKIEAGKLEIENIEFNLKEIINNLYDMLGNKALEKGIGLNIFIDENIPLFLIGDPMRISQILINLINNAIKFTEKGEVVLKVSLKEKFEREALLVFEVIDTGIGLSKDQRFKLFSAYSQAEISTYRKYGGTGLGLNICKLLVSMMGGDISVTSPAKNGCGSNFYFTIKFTIQDNQKSIELYKKTEEYDEENINKIKGAKILLVEDNKINQQLAVEILKNAGLTTDVAENGKEAFLAVTNHKFDAVLMDIEMPDMNGYEVTRKIRSDIQFQKLPIIAMTAHAMIGEREKCLKVGMNDYITKPIDTHKLFSALAKWIALEKREPILQEIYNYEDIKIDLPETLPGIDIKHALNRVMGNKGLILNLLKEFHRDLGNSTAKIKEAIIQGEKNAAQRIAHTVKGVAGNLGMMELSKKSLELEIQIKKGLKDAASIVVDNFEYSLGTVLESLKILDKNNIVEVREEKFLPLDINSLMLILDNLRSLLKENNFEAEEYLLSIKPHLNDIKIKDEVKMLQENISFLKFDDAIINLETICEILQRIS
ncbi:MAG: response regulator [Desulfobacterales bacterium]|nr:response regulator [Desulfobacterales bacterium]